MSIPIDADGLVEILDASGLMVRPDYHGRGMGARGCVAGVTDASADLLKICAEIVDNCPDAEAAAWLLRGAKIDNMGLGIVIYWPRISAIEASEE